MYHNLKQFVKKIVPQQFLFKHELFFRKFLIPFYSGKKYQCNICNHQWKNFIQLPDGDLLCPYCSSRSRTRRLHDLLFQNEKLLGKVLHFSPSRSLYRKLKQNQKITYFSSDFENEFLADHRFDITKIDAPNENFDFIICYHILEHIVDDQKAMAELFRVLKMGGKCYVQTPFKNGEIYENKKTTTPEERLREFGQEDHVRVYSIKGLKQRLEKVGFTVKILHFEEELIPFGLLEEHILILEK